MSGLVLFSVYNAGNVEVGSKKMFNCSVLCHVPAIYHEIVYFIFCDRVSARVEYGRVLREK